MGNLHLILLVLQVFISICLIGLILIQHGKGADAGAAFGSGASSTVFGSSGSGNFLTRSTTVLAIAFLGNSLLLAYLATIEVEPKSLMEQTEQVVIEQPIQESMEEVETESMLDESDIPVLPANE